MTESQRARRDTRENQHAACNSAEYRRGDTGRLAPSRPYPKARPTVFFDALDALGDVHSERDFIAWTRTELRALLPHGALICGVGRIHASVARPLNVIKVDFPAEYLEAIRAPDGQYRTPTMQRWLASGEPQVFEPETAPPETDVRWLKLFVASGLRNIAAHGMLDIAGEYASYFSFHRLPGPLGEPHRQTLKLIVPHMHLALLALLGRAGRTEATPSAPALTVREREVLQWMREGKSNDEIAAILGLSTATVKNQTCSIYSKLEVCKRPQAVAKAIALGLIAATRTTARF